MLCYLIHSNWLNHSICNPVLIMQDKTVQTILITATLARVEAAAAVGALQGVEAVNLVVQHMVLLLVVQVLLVVLVVRL